MRDCRLECVQAVIERQKRMPAEANDDRLFLDRQHRRSRFLWSRPSVHDRAARLPLAHRLLIDAVTSGERSQALFTMLYRSTDRLSRRGAPVKNLAHSASFDSCNKNAPSKCGTKQVGAEADWVRAVCLRRDVCPCILRGHCGTQRVGIIALVGE